METKAAGLSLMSLAKDLKVTLPGGDDAAPSEAPADPFATLLMQSVAALADPATAKTAGSAAETEVKADKEESGAATPLVATDTAAGLVPLTVAVDMPHLKSPFNLVPGDAKAGPASAYRPIEAAANAVLEPRREVSADVSAQRAASSEKFAEVIQSLPRDKVADQVAVAFESTKPDAPQTQSQPAVGINTQLQAQTLSQPAAAPPQTHATNVLSAPIGSPAWDDALGQKVIWMAGDQLSSAEITLNPPNLGPVEIKLSLSGDQASALFVAHHASVRDALDAAVPRLREMLADAGLNLANVSVGSESFQQSSPDAYQNQAAAARAVERDRPLTEIAPVAVAAVRHKGMVDLFA